MMVAELDIRTSTAYSNAGRTIGLAQFRKGMSADEFMPSVKAELKKYNGWIVTSIDEYSINRVFFDTENDMLLFTLRWS